MTRATWTTNITYQPSESGRMHYEIKRYAAQLEDRAERANVHTAGLLIEIARELRKIAGAE